MASRIQLRRDSAINWTTTNPVLAQGEFGVETDTLKFKIGNGILDWVSLPYAGVSLTLDSEGNITEINGIPITQYEPDFTLNSEGDITAIDGHDIAVPPSGVTSVALSVPAGLEVSGSPITSSGTFSVTYETGYSIPANSDQANWNTAYGWGNHADAGYLDGADIGVTVQGYDSNLKSFLDTFTLPTVDGAAGDVLTTDGDGNLVFGQGGGGSFSYVLSDVLQYNQSSDIASGTTVDLSTATGNDVTITHSTVDTATTSFGAASALQAGTRIRCRASISGGTLTLTHNATSMIIPGGADWLLADGDSFDAVKISDSQAYWRIENISLANGEALVGGTDKIQPITASVGSNALTITLNPTTLDFRDATLGSGTVNTRKVPSAISVVVSSGSTLGTVNAVANRLAVLAIDNAGTVELAVVNLAGGVNLDETGVISTTAEGGAGAADSATVIYSTTARTNVPYRVVGFVESTQATAGTWASAPSLIQGYGGQAFAAMSSLGYGQTWQSVGGSRLSGTTYYNTTGKPIIAKMLNASPGGGIFSITVSGLQVGYFVTSPSTNGECSAIVPPGAPYVYNYTVGVTIMELR